MNPTKRNSNSRHRQTAVDSHDKRDRLRIGTNATLQYITFQLDADDIIVKRKIDFEEEGAAELSGHRRRSKAAKGADSI